MDAERRYWAFISYSHADGRWARWLHRGLETYVVPARLVGRPTPAGPTPRRLRPIFRDREDLAADPSLRSRVDSALERSGALIVICSPAAARSPWVEREVELFTRLHGAERVFAVIVAGTATARPGREGELCFPEALRFAIGAHGERTGRPADLLAADLREGGDGRRRALLKLVAGMIGAELDELAHRDAQRRIANLSALAAVSAGVAVAMGALALEAVSARDEARRQRTDAEDLVKFMLGDLKDRLKQFGRLDVLDAVGAKAMQYYDRRRDERLDPVEQDQRAQILHLLGDINDEKGDLAAASRDFAGAAATTEALLARHPDAPQALFDHAQSVYYLGYIALRRGDHRTAEQRFAQYKALAQRLTAQAPENDRWRRELAYAEGDLGVLYLDEGRPAEARRAFDTVIGIDRALLERRPADHDLTMDTGQDYAWRADAELRGDDVATARADRLAERALYDRLLAAQPADDTAFEALAVNEMALANLEARLGDNRAALAEIGACLERYRRLRAADPANTRYAARQANALTNWSGYLLKARETGAARRAAEQAVAIAEGLVRRDPGVAYWRGRLLGGARIAALKSAARGAAGETALQRVLAGAAPEAARLAPIATATPSDQVLARLAGEAMTLAADADALAGHLDVARAGWSRAAQILVRSGIDSRGTDAGPTTLARIGQRLRVRSGLLLKRKLLAEYS